MRHLTRDEILTRLDIAYDILLTASIIGSKLFSPDESTELHKMVDYLKKFSDELDESYRRSV